jgi:hypothetical protein
VGIIATSCLFIFGLVFLLLLNGESQVGTIFLVFWMAIVGLMLGNFIYSLVNYDKNKGLGGSIMLEDEDELNNKAAGFDDRDTTDHPG